MQDDLAKIGAHIDAFDSGLTIPRRRSSDIVSSVKNAQAVDLES
jgi:hypothetical protein